MTWHAPSRPPGSAFDDGPTPWMSVNERAGDPAPARGFASAVRDRLRADTSDMEENSPSSSLVAPAEEISTTGSNATLGAEFPFIERRAVFVCAVVVLGAREPVGVVGAIVPVERPGVGGPLFKLPDRR